MSKSFSVALAPRQLSQVINPWSWSMGDFSLFTVNLGQSGAPDVEAKVLDEVGSYGRQLGRIGDALRVLLDHFKLEDLTGAEQKAIDDLRLQLDHVDVLKREAASATAVH
jgi:hypothetical protein